MENKPKSKMNKSLLILGIGLLIIGLLLILTLKSLGEELVVIRAFLGMALLMAGGFMAAWQITKPIRYKSSGEKDRWR